MATKKTTIMELRSNVLRMRPLCSLRWFSSQQGQHSFLQSQNTAMRIAKQTGKTARTTIQNMLPRSNLSTQRTNAPSQALSSFSCRSHIFWQVPSPLSTCASADGMSVVAILVVLHRRPGCCLVQVASEEDREDRGAALAALCTIGPPTSSESGQREMTASALAGAHASPVGIGSVHRLVSFFVSSLFVPDAERAIVLARRGIFWTRTENF